ncbi:MAG: SUMF1/EgtB/PvdO family nonheme iron enzyme [Verrucomicrobiales bacterium]
MKLIKPMMAVAAFGLALGMMAANAQQIVTTTDTFGSGMNTSTIDFVTVGNPGNGNDGSGYGGVPYTYRISTYEISQNDITTATATVDGLTNVTAGAHSGDRPAANISWYEAAAFVNWLNTSNGHQAAYDLAFTISWSMTLWSSADAWQLGGENLYRHKDAYYFLPSEDEWYKAAYHQNDGVTANYWDYATGSNTAPTPVASGTASGTAVYLQEISAAPADVSPRRAA